MRGQGGGAALRQETPCCRQRPGREIPDPKGLPLGEFRRVRDQIEEKVRELIQGLWLPKSDRGTAGLHA